MKRLLLDFWPCVVRVTIGLALFSAALAAPVAISLYLGHPLLALVCVAAIGVRVRTLLPAVRAGWHWEWRLSKAARGFWRHADSHAIFYCDPSLSNVIDLPALTDDCRRDLADLAGQFGFSLRRRPLVFIFASARDISSVFGWHYNGFALARANAIVVAADALHDEVIRHELTHVFAAKWNSFALPLLNEGLATWSQGTVGGQPLDVVVVNCSVATRSLLPAYWIHSTSI